MRKSFKLTTLFDIPVEVNYSWFIILGLVVFTLASGYFPLTNPELPTSIHWLIAVIAALLLFASLLAHEFAHAIVAKRNNLPISGITLFVFGGVAHMEEEPASPHIEFKMAIAGPLMSFFLATLFYVLTNLAYQVGLPNVVLAITNYLMLINIVVGIFNLIPGFPLDGGRIFRALLWHFMKDLQRATRIAARLGKGFAYFLIAFGFYNLFNSTFISGVWMIFIGLFLSEAAEVSYRQVTMKKILSGTQVEKIMTANVITVPANVTVDKLIDDFFFRYRHASFPVIEDDKVMGLLTLHNIKDVEKKAWPKTEAKTAMIPMSELLVINKHADVLQALAKMARTGVGRLLVIEKAKLIGIVSQQDITRLFEFKSEIER